MLAHLNPHFVRSRAMQKCCYTFLWIAMICTFPLDVCAPSVSAAQRYKEMGEKTYDLRVYCYNHERPMKLIGVETISYFNMALPSSTIDRVKHLVKNRIGYPFEREENYMAKRGFGKITDEETLMWTRHDGYNFEKGQNDDIPISEIPEIREHLGYTLQRDGTWIAPDVVEVNVQSLRPLWVDSDASLPSVKYVPEYCGNDARGDRGGTEQPDYVDEADGAAGEWKPGSDDEGEDEDGR